MKITFIGGGNLARSIIGGLIKQGHVSTDIIVTNRSKDKLKKLEEDFNITTCESNAEAAAKADIIVIAVKPGDVQGVAKEIAESITPSRHLVLSLAAGVKIGDIHKWLSVPHSENKIKIVKCMTGTPALIGEGATALYANQYLSEEDKKIANHLLTAIGKTAWVHSEEELDAITTLVSSGPAYVFYFIQYMQKAAITLGVSPVTAKEMALQTAFGAAKMASASPLDIEELRKQVTTPNGMTARAIAQFDLEKMPDIILKGMEDALKRCLEFGQIFSMA